MIMIQVCSVRSASAVCSSPGMHEARKRARLSQKELERIAGQLMILEETESLAFLVVLLIEELSFGSR